MEQNNSVVILSMWQILRMYYTLMRCTDCSGWVCVPGGINQTKNSDLYFMAP